MRLSLSPRAFAITDPQTYTNTALVKWLIGLRLIAISALFLGAILVQTATEEELPISPLLRVAFLTYALSAVWVVLWLVRVPAKVHGALQLAGDLGIASMLLYITGGPTSPFAFIFLIIVAVGALLFGLRGAFTFAGTSFVLYGGMIELIVYHILPPPRFGAHLPPLGESTVAFQVFVTGAGFAIVALLTSYLAQSLRETEQRLYAEQTAMVRLLALSANVLGSVDSGVLATDNQGTVVLANPAAQKILFWLSKLEGAHLNQLLVFDDINWSATLGSLSKGPPLRIEGTIQEHGLPLGCTVTPLQAEGKTVGAVVHFRDLTEAREAGKLERLRERMMAIGEMAAGIAHEIRNPLASISGSAQVLGRLPGLGVSEKRLLRIIVEESRRLSGIVESFLGYARPPDHQRGACDIARTLEETLALFVNSSELSDKHRIRTDITPHHRPVTADEKQLRQAFYNLARNAIQAMPDGGTMTVVAGPESDSYVVRWSDEGVGMESQQTQEIFQPFRAFRHGGTGLGLAVVYSIVTDHNGEIAVESEIGRGTTFIIRLPMEAS